MVLTKEIVHSQISFSHVFHIQIHMIWKYQLVQIYPFHMQFHMENELVHGKIYIEYI